MTRANPPGGLQWLGLTAILFAFLHGVQFSAFPISTSRVVVLIGVPFLVLEALRCARTPIPATLQAVACALLAPVAWLCISGAASGLVANSLLGQMLLMVLHSVTGALFVVALAHRWRFDLDRFTVCVLATIVLQAVFVLLYVFHAGFRDFTFAHIPESGNVDHQLMAFRSRGLRNGAGSYLAVIQSFGLFLIVRVAATGCRGAMAACALAASAVLITTSILLTGRSGLIALPIVAGVVLHVRGATPAGRTGLGRLGAWLVVFLMLAAVGAFLSIRAIGDGGIDLAAQLLDGWMRWMLSEVDNGSGMGSRTVEILLDHWIAPPNLETALVGNPASWTVDRTPSDVGYVRVFHAGGAIGLVLVYGFFLLFLAALVQLAPTPADRAMAFALALYMVLLETKEPYLLNLDVNMYLLALLFAMALLSPSSPRAPGPVRSVAPPTGSPATA